ncbi:MAG: hypothetical protein ACLQFR_29440 [Streptosporangiaceae bacterium]
MKDRAVVTECGVSAGVRVATLGSGFHLAPGNPGSANQLPAGNEAISMADWSHGQSARPAVATSWAARAVI